MSDIEIARQANKQKIIDLAREKLDIREDALEPYAHSKAKLRLNYIESLSARDDGKLILVTRISPTPPGEGKTKIRPHSSTADRSPTSRLKRAATRIYKSYKTTIFSDEIAPRWRTFKIFNTPL